MNEYVDLGQMAADCMKSIQEKVKNLKRLNIMIIGKTGVGKSTLVNQVFRDNLAETGIGRPVTDHTRRFSKDGCPLVIYDTKGFELGTSVQDQVKEEILDIIDKGFRPKDYNEAIHCIWYCINTASDRIEDVEIEWLKDFAKRNQSSSVPIIVVLTKSFSKKHALDMKNAVLNENLHVAQVIPVLAMDYELDGEYVIKAYGLDTLINVMGEVLPAELQETLQNVQIASIEAKRKLAHAAVATAVTLSAAEAAAPIPFSDAFLLVPTQVGMIASITAIYGIEINKGMIIAFLTSALSSGGATIAGKAIVSSIIKLIPGVGSIAGGVIAASTAGVLTTAIGEAYIQLMEAVYRGEIKEYDLTTDVGKQKFKELVKLGK